MTEQQSRRPSPDSSVRRDPPTPTRRGRTTPHCLRTRSNLAIGMATKRSFDSLGTSAPPSPRDVGDCPPGGEYEVRSHARVKTRSWSRARIYSLDVVAACVRKGQSASRLAGGFSVAEQKSPDHGGRAAAIVPSSSEKGMDAGGCSATRATARSACWSPRIGPPASTRRLLFSLAERSRSRPRGRAAWHLLTSPRSACGADSPAFVCEQVRAVGVPVPRVWRIAGARRSDVSALLFRQHETRLSREDDPLS